MNTRTTSKKPFFARAWVWITIAAVAILLIVSPSTLALAFAIALPFLLLTAPVAIIGYVVFRIVSKHRDDQDHHFIATGPAQYTQPDLHAPAIPYQNDPALAYEANLMENNPALAEALDLDGEDDLYR